MLSFLHPWDYCWKCEFDTDVKIENYYQHDGEQLGFYKKKHIKTPSKKKNVLCNFMLLQETKNSNLFDKNWTQENVKCHNQHEESWLRWNRDWTCKLQVTLLSAFISWKKVCSHTLKASSEEVIAKIPTVPNVSGLSQNQVPRPEVPKYNKLVKAFSSAFEEKLQFLFFHSPNLFVYKLTSSSTARSYYL